ncbi:MAG TPA: GTP-binding protein [Burkholderiaceae bacterium]|nr:GTP-binding protein [Burkholderiaceae bacterium]
MRQPGAAADDRGGVDSRLRLRVVGGFLGSGKTTWLRHRLRASSMAGLIDSGAGAWSRGLRNRPPLKTVVLVNEFAGCAIDDSLLAAQAEVRVLTGGCVCCDAREALRQILRGLVNERHESLPEQRVERVILETSGLADPRPIVELVTSDAVLTSNLLLDELVVTLDAVRGREQLRSEALGRAQVSLADRIVVTKVDQTDPDELAVVVAVARRLNPGARISGAVQGVGCPLPDASVPVDAAALAEVSPGCGPGSGEPAPVAIELPVDATTDWPSFTVWLSALLHAHGQRILRIKGIVPTPAGRLVLQGVGATVQVPELLPDETGRQTAGRVVMIGRGLDAELVRRSFETFTGSG